MSYLTETLSESKIQQLFDLEENHFHGYNYWIKTEAFGCLVQEQFSSLTE